MIYNVPPHDYDEYIRRVTEDDHKSLIFAKSVIGMTLISSAYVTSLGIIPYFTDANKTEG